MAIVSSHPRPGFSDPQIFTSLRPQFPGALCRE
jgi:hypothetical protein